MSRDINSVTTMILSVAAEAGDRAVRFERALADLAEVARGGGELDGFWKIRVEDSAPLCGAPGPPGPFEPCCLFVDHGGEHHIGARAQEISQRDRILSRSARNS